PNPWWLRVPAYAGTTAAGFVPRALEHVGSPLSRGRTSRERSDCGETLESLLGRRLRRGRGRRRLLLRIHLHPRPCPHQAVDDDAVVGSESLLDYAHAVDQLAERHIALARDA